MRGHRPGRVAFVLLILIASTAVEVSSVEVNSNRDPLDLARFRLRDAHWTLARGVSRLETELERISDTDSEARHLLETYRTQFHRQLAKVRSLERRQSSALLPRESGSVSDFVEQVGKIHLTALKMSSSFESRGIARVQELEAKVSGVSFVPAAASACYGSIAGTVQGPDGPLMDVLVAAYSADGINAGSSLSLVDGSYQIDGLLSGEEFYVITSNADALIDEVFNDVECPGGGCDPAIGSAVTVSAGVIASGIDFALAAGGAIGGSITALPGPVPLPFTTVNIFDAAGELVTSAMSDLIDGAFITETGLPTGSYYVVTANLLGNLDELYDDLPCAAGVGCEPTTGTTVAVTGPNLTTGIDLELAEGGHITGTITGTVTASPLGDILVGIHDDAGQLIAFGASDVTGTYSILSGLPTGSFYAATGNLEGYVDELYNDIPCTGGLCAITSGQQIPVTQGETTAEIDFALSPGGTFAGTVTKAADGSSLAEVFILAHTAAGDLIGTGTTDMNGAYTLASGLATGSYRATTLNPLGLDDLLFDDLPCPESVCDVTLGTPIPVTAGINTADIDFALPGDALGSCDFEGCSTCSLTTFP